MSSSENTWKLNLKTAPTIESIVLKVEISSRDPFSPVRIPLLRSSIIEELLVELSTHGGTDTPPATVGAGRMDGHWDRGKLLKSVPFLII